MTVAQPLRESPDTLTVNAGSGRDTTTTLQERVWITQALKTVRLSPSEALQRTLLDGQTFTSQYPSEVVPSVTLEMREQIQQTFGVPAVW